MSGLTTLLADGADEGPEKNVIIVIKDINLSGKFLRNYARLPFLFLVGKSTINGPFSMAILT